MHFTSRFWEPLADGWERNILSQGEAIPEVNNLGLHSQYVTVAATYPCSSREVINDWVNKTMKFHALILSLEYGNSQKFLSFFIINCIITILK